jgi:hypothetical protein
VTKSLDAVLFESDEADQIVAAVPDHAVTDEMRMRPSQR